MASQRVHFNTQISNPDFPTVFDVDPKEVWEKKSEVVIVDVRRPDEFEGELGHIPGAQLVVLNTLPGRLPELPMNKTIVFACRSGGRSSQATAFAQENGFENVYNMKGGMLLWNQLGLECEGRSKT